MAATTVPAGAVTGAGGKRVDPGVSRRRRQTMIAWLFALPFVLVFGVFMLVPAGRRRS